jgi:hypothetical protein
MLWGQQIKVFTDHANLMRDALGFTSDQVYQWWLLLEEYGPKIVYIKGIHNTMADAVSQLEYDPSVNLGWEFQFLVPISGTPIGSGFPIPFSIPEIPVRIFFSYSAVEKTRNRNSDSKIRNSQKK